MILVLSFVVIAFWLMCNVVVATRMSFDEMYEDLVEGQSPIGRVLANSFYWLAWIIKGLEIIF